MNNLSSEDRKLIQRNVRGLKNKILWKKVNFQKRKI